MAISNADYIEILKQGGEVWNTWRMKDFEGVADVEFPEVNLVGANLSGADLRAADLRWTDLSKANLRETNLTEAVLSGSKLREADLSGADLRRVNLTEADLTEAVLSGASLMEANLFKANLSRADLSRADLSRADLLEANLNGAVLFKAKLIGAHLLGADFVDANLFKANLILAKLYGANLSGAKLLKADLRGVDLREADLSRANLVEANLREADLSRANLCKADLIGADLSVTTLIETNFEHANISGCRIFGISAWKLKVEHLTQSNLVITERNESEITVDNLEVAQFVYLLLNNEKLRSVIDTLTTKSVLILGRFTPERKAVLDAVRQELRKQGYIPLLFDFKKPDNRDFTETVMTLASLSRFVIVDLSDPNSIPHELMSFTEKLFSVPVKPIFCSTEEHPKPYPMFEDHLGRLPHVLPIYEYLKLEELVASLEEKVIKPAEQKLKEVRRNPLP